MTDERITALTSRRTMRDKHPARSARVLATGVSVSALASLVSAFTVQAATDQNEPSSVADPDAQIAPLTSSSLPPTAPTLPAPATPAPIRHIVEVDVIQPPTPVATTQAPRESTSIESSPFGGADWSGIGSINIGGGGGSGGGGSSGGSGGSR